MPARAAEQTEAIVALGPIGDDLRPVPSAPANSNISADIGEPVLSTPPPITDAASPSEIEAVPVKVGLSDSFVRDLAIIYKEFPPEPNAEECVHKLAGIFDKQRREIIEREQNFSRDLRTVYRSLGGGHVDDANLERLASVFDTWRRGATDELTRFFAEIPIDDPLRCPIGLFGIIQYGRLETAHTRMLAWLLDPSKEHGFGDRLLRALFAHLTGRELPGQIAVENTEAEFIIDNGRLDVLIRGRFSKSDSGDQGWLLLVEAKINANEAEDQLWKYERWANKHSRNRQVFRMFLTPEGRNPTTAKEHWIPVSFSQLACVFRAVAPDLRDQPGFHFLKHYLSGVLKDICRWQLPIMDPRSCEDVYSFVDYLRIVAVSKGANS